MPTKAELELQAEGLQAEFKIAKRTIGKLDEEAVEHERAVKSFRRTINALKTVIETRDGSVKNLEQIVNTNQKEFDGKEKALEHQIMEYSDLFKEQENKINRLQDMLLLADEATAREQRKNSQAQANPSKDEELVEQAIEIVQLRADKNKLSQELVLVGRARDTWMQAADSTRSSEEELEKVEREVIQLEADVEVLKRIVQEKATTIEKQQEEIESLRQDSARRKKVIGIADSYIALFNAMLDVDKEPDKPDPVDSRDVDIMALEVENDRLKREIKEQADLINRYRKQIGPIADLEDHPKQIFSGEKLLRLVSERDELKGRLEKYEGSECHYVSTGEFSRVQRELDEAKSASENWHKTEAMRSQRNKELDVLLQKERDMCQEWRDKCYKRLGEIKILKSQVVVLKQCVRELDQPFETRVEQALGLTPVDTEEEGKIITPESYVRLGNDRDRLKRLADDQWKEIVKMRTEINESEGAKARIKLLRHNLSEALVQDNKASEQLSKEKTNA